MKKTLLLPVMGALFATSAWSHAALVIGWDFDPLAGGVNNFGPTPLAATTTDANVTSGGLIRGSGVGTTGTGGANGWGGNDFTITTPSFAVALAANEFFTFSITTAEDYELSLSRIWVPIMSGAPQAAPLPDSGSTRLDPGPFKTLAARSHGEPSRRVPAIRRVPSVWQALQSSRALLLRRPSPSGW